MIVFAFLAAVLAFVPSSAMANDGMYTIDAFDANIAVHDDGSLAVNETIAVDFRYARHGIYRYVPFRYTTWWGLRHVTPISDVTILQDGVPAQVETYNENGNVVWKIGDKDVTIDGEHTYEIFYTVDDALLFDDAGQARLYWNVTGSDWDGPMTSSSVGVGLPNAVRPVSAACYAGETGSTAQECVVTDEATFDDALHAIAVTAHGPFTIDVVIPEGAVAVPTTFVRVLHMVRDNIVALFGLLLVPVPFLLWFLRGRDARLGAIVPEYEPPEGYAAAYLVARDARRQRHLFAAMIVTLAQQGYLRIHATEEKAGIFGGTRECITLEKCKEKDGLDAPHQTLFVALTKKADADGRVALHDHQGLLDGMTIRRVKEGLRKRLTDDGLYEPHSFRWQDTMIVVGIVCTMGGMFLAAEMGNAGFVLFVLVGICTIFSALCIPKLTPKGLAFERHVRGFRMFMHTAERYRSAWQERESMFTEYLPYAIAFGDVHRWAKAFEGTQALETAPSWYSGSMAHGWSYLAFAQSLSTVESAVAAAMPSSHGGGGGFSGGGFGGGGGGSW